VPVWEVLDWGGEIGLSVVRRARPTSAIRSLRPRSQAGMADSTTGAEAVEAAQEQGRGLPEDVVWHHRALIVRDGLPVELRVRRDGRWAAIDTWPLAGFTHCCSLEQYRWHVDNGWPYHISLGWDVDPELVTRLATRLDGVQTIIEIQGFTPNGVAMLADRGLGADPELRAAYEQGHRDRLWVLHISM